MVGNELNSTGNEMKALMAAIALLCVSSTVLAHDIYSTLRDRDGHLCCGGQDCKPVQAVVLPDGNYYLPGTDEVIPADIAAPSPDDRFHHCIYHHVYIGSDPCGYPPWDTTPTTRCFFAPMNSSQLEHGPHSNFANNRFASSCDIRRPIISVATFHLPGR